MENHFKKKFKKHIGEKHYRNITAATLEELWRNTGGTLEKHMRNSRKTYEKHWKHLKH